MATYYSDKGGLRFQPRNRPEGALIAEPFSLTLTANAANSDIFILGRLPAGSTLVGYTIEIPAVDSNATPNTSIGIGDSGSATRFMNTAVANTGARYTSWVSSTAANSALGSGGTVGFIIDGADVAALPRTYTASDDLRVTITAGVATAAGNTNTIKGTYFYVMQPFYSDPVL